MLAEMVEAGTLPPLDQRLPQNPLVWDAKDVQILEPEEARYGGTLKLGHVKDIDMLAQVNYARLLSDRSEFVPHFAEGWEFSDDFTSLTFFLRKGLRGPMASSTLPPTSCGGGTTSCNPSSQTPRRACTIWTLARTT